MFFTHILVAYSALIYLYVFVFVLPYTLNAIFIF